MYKSHFVHQPARASTPQQAAVNGGGTQPSGHPTLPYLNLRPGFSFKKSNFFFTMYLFIDFSRAAKWFCGWWLEVKYPRVPGWRSPNPLQSPLPVSQQPATGTLIAPPHPTPTHPCLPLPELSLAQGREVTRESTFATGSICKRLKTLIAITHPDLVQLGAIKPNDANDFLGVSIYFDKLGTCAS